MKIAIIHPYFSTFTGAENFAIELANGLVDNGHEVYVYTGDFPKGVKKVKFNIRFVKINMRMETWPKAVKYLREELQNFDLINYHNYPSGILVQLALRKMKKKPKTLWFCQEPYEPLYGKSIQENKKRFLKKILNLKFHINRILDRRLMRKTDVCIGNSKRTAAFAQHIYKKQFNPVYPVTLKEDLFKKKNLAKPKKNYLFAVGRITRSYKNIETVLEAFTIVHKEKPEYKLIYAGSGSDLDYFRNFIKESGLDKAVKFPGFISDKKVHEYFATACLILNLTLVEPFGLIAIEPSPYATPVLNSDSSGAAEILKNGKTAFLCKPDNPVIIAKKIIKILNDKNKRISVAKNAFDYGKENYTINTVIKKIMALI